MMRWVCGALLLGLLLPAQIGLLQFCGSARASLPAAEAEGYVLPAPFLKAVSLEYKGLVADILFLKSLVFFGSTMERGQNTYVLHDWEWGWLKDMLTTSAELDPYFSDPYYFGGSILSLNPELVDEVNQFLERGTKYRSWDWMLPFYLGWNYFNYKNDHAKAAELLQESYRRNEKNTLVATLAARLSYQANRTEDSLIFLEQIIRATTDRKTKELYKTRYAALQGVLVLEQARDRYVDIYREYPKTPLELQQRGILRQLPEDPYGGNYYFTDDHEVKTTSNLVPAKD